MKPRLKRDASSSWWCRLSFGRAKLLFVSLLALACVGILLPAFLVHDVVPNHKMEAVLRPPRPSRRTTKSMRRSQGRILASDQPNFERRESANQIESKDKEKTFGTDDDESSAGKVKVTKETGLHQSHTDQVLLLNRAQTALQKTDEAPRVSAATSSRHSDASSVKQAPASTKPPLLLPKHLRKGPVTTIYSQARKDRFGAGLLYYFMGHAYAKKYGLVYGGICGNTTTLEQQCDLIDFLGLSQELPRACPDETMAENEYYILPYFLNVDQKTKIEYGTKLLTAEWVKHMRERGSSILRKEFRPNDDSRQSQVAVHLRRGDVQICHVWRYLPNQHYLDILDRYLPSDTAQNVTIYTEAKSAEGIKPFEERNYNINIDGELMNVWTAMIQADVLILSRSDFSLVPAIFNSGKVLYTPWADDKVPLAHWETIDESISNKTFEQQKTTCRKPPLPSVKTPLAKKEQKQLQATAPIFRNESQRDVHDLASLTWNASEACYNWKGARREIPSPQNVPKALIVTLLLGPPKLITLACQTIPNQLHYFAQPQGLDWLILVDDPLQVENLTECLDLDDLGQPARFWKNDDGSTMQTKSYRFKGDERTTILLAQTKIMQNLNLDPNWNQSKLPMVCNRYPLSYIQGTRWYSNEMIHLAILKEYDYFLKMDLDIYFLKPWNHFSLTADMRQKRAIFGHAAHYVKGGCSCTRGISQAVKKYQHQIQQTQFCSDLPFVHRNCDYYFTNFIIGEVEFWTQPKVQHFARFLTELPYGFTTERWTDQIFFHNAMALFVGPNFEEAVADYTDIRCMPDPTCWESIGIFLLQGYNEYSPHCDGYMVHTKRIRDSKFAAEQKVETAKVLSAPYKSSYVYSNSTICRA